MVIHIVKFKSGLSDTDAERIMKERMPQFHKLPGLMQKFYGREIGTGEFAGIYVWDSEESLAKFRESELARTIAAAYDAQGTPRIEAFEVLDQLRD